VADGSPLVRQSIDFLRSQTLAIRDRALRDATLDATTNPDTCVRHRASLSAAEKQALLDRVLADGLYALADAAAFPGGVMAGVFPPVLADGTACPKLPQPFRSAPGSAFHGHHSMPGGLPIHEAFNEKSDVSLAENYGRNYRAPGLPDGHGRHATFAGLSEDVVLAAPIWHDWAKAIVFQCCVWIVRMVRAALERDKGASATAVGAASDDDAASHKARAATREGR